MPLFITSTSTATRHDVYAIEGTPPLTIRGTGTSRVGYVAQLPWGPMVTESVPGTFKDVINMYGPPGMTHTGSGYLGLIGKPWIPGQLGIVRVLGPTAVKAQIALQTFVTAIAKYEGTEGNSIVCTVSNASDGDANHFNLKVEVTGASGTSTDFLQNLNYSGVGADSVPVFTNTILLGNITKQLSGRPANNTYTMAAGTNGTVTSTEYVGTAGTADKGIALLEGDDQVRLVCTDDPGNSLRAAVNAGLVAHYALLTDRVVFLNGNSGLSLAATATDVASYRSQGVVYVDPWYRKYDDVTGALQLVAPAALAAAVASNMSPSTSIAWKNAEVQALMRDVVSLETDRGAGAGSNTAQGVVTIIREATGGFTFEAGKVTINASDPAKGNLTRTRMGIYIAKSLKDSVRSIIDAPNVEVNQDDVVQAVDAFLDGLKRAQKTDPNHTPYILDYAITPVSQSNTTAELAAGDLNINISVKIGSSIERLFFRITYGETVIVTQQAA